MLLKAAEGLSRPCCASFKASASQGAVQAASPSLLPLRPMSGNRALPAAGLWRLPCAFGRGRHLGRRQQRPLNRRPQL